jgi:hypothetical protein
VHVKLSLRQAADEVGQGVHDGRTARAGASVKLPRGPA